jgi:hypothetical protein
MNGTELFYGLYKQLCDHKETAVLMMLQMYVDVEAQTSMAAPCTHNFVIRPVVNQSNGILKSNSCTKPRVAAQNEHRQPYRKHVSGGKGNIITRRNTVYIS